MLVSFALTAAIYTVCSAHACTKRLDQRLDETQWPETRDETYWTETETYCSETEMRPETHRSEIKTLRILSETRLSRDRDVSTETTSLFIRKQRRRKPKFVGQG